MVCRVGRSEIVLLGGEDDLRLDGEMLRETEINETAQLGADTHIRTHRTVVAGDDEITHVRTHKETAGHQSRQFLLIQRVQKMFCVELHELRFHVV